MNKVTPENWEKVKKIFNEAMRQPVGSRESFLKHSCGDDTELRREVESLLASYKDADSFLEKPLIENSSDSAETEQLHFQNSAKFGHYEVIRQIGSGGMGEVYLAQDTKLDRKVAIKILNEKFAQHESNLQRFIQEAKSASALNHPNILTIYQIGETENAHYMVSEYIEGETLRELLQKKALLLTDVLDIAVQLANALSAAHSAKIVHRDIKPENIIVRPDGFVKILDFGLAKLVETNPIGFDEKTLQQNQTAKGIILGTINYMSPEQAKGEKVDERTDIFSFGVLLYEMIAGRMPFAGDSTPETFANLINKEPQPLIQLVENLPDKLEKIIAKMLSKKKDERYQSAKNLSIDLKDLRENLNSELKLKKANSFDNDNETLTLPEGAKFTNIQEAKTNTNSSEKIKRPKLLISIALIAFFIGIIGFGYALLIPQNNPTTQNKVIKSLAVLPFINASQDPNAEYLSDGIADSVINRLSQVSNLRVMSRNSAFQFKENQTELKKIAAKLNVEALVLGDIKQVGDKFVINVRLINTQDDSTVWGNQYVKTTEDIIATQNEIAKAVAQNLRVKLSELDHIRLNKNYQENPEAYQLYLKGRFHISKVNLSEIERGIAYFQEAIQIDPNYALAYAGLADAYRTLPLGAEFVPAEYYPKAKETARKALEIDDSLAEANAVLCSSAFWYDWDWTASENYCQKALENNPNSADARFTYAHLLSNLGRHDEALEQAKRARELDPLNVRINFLEAQFLMHAGQIDVAFGKLEKAYELDPNFIGYYHFMPSLLIEKGKFDEAIALARKGQEIFPNNSRTKSFLGYALAKSGNHTEAESVVENLVKSSNERYVSACNIALIYNGLGETDKALSWLEKGLTQRDPLMTFLKVEPKWNNLRGNSHFQEILRRIGLASTPLNTSSKFYWQMSDAEQLAFIQERARHIETMIGGETIELDDNALQVIKVEISQYIKRRDSLSQKPFEEGLRVIYGRASQYSPVIIRAYEKWKVAAALGLYQAMIESEYHDCPNVIDHPKAPVGMFQFSRKTAAKYGLTEKDYCNVEKQAEAAAHYMSDLKSDFGEGKSNVALGLLSYNVGEENVRECLRKLRERGVTERSFWTIFRYREDFDIGLEYLPPPASLINGGLQYVPRFYAAAIIGETPETFELSTPPLTTLRDKGK